MAASLLQVSTEQKISELLRKMTLAEKIGQLNQYALSEEDTGPGQNEVQIRERLDRIRRGEVGSVLNLVGAANTRKVQRMAVEESRLGIPLIFGYDVIHGYRTMFPLPLAEAASWDLEAIKMSASIAAREAAAAGVHWTFAPMVDVSRDARWGRVMEGAGEDPFLGKQVAKARVEGFQGEDLAAPDTVAACAKHFAAYGFSESGKDYNIVDISRNTLHNFVLPPFKAAAEAGVATFMNAFNDIGGTPATANPYLQRQILKGLWRFMGFVVSDWNSIGEMIDHGVAESLAEAARLAIRAGSDMDMEADAYHGQLANLLAENKIAERWIDEAVRRVLRVKFALGLFDDPYRYCNEGRESAILYSKEHRHFARDIARKSLVLLKNEDHLLPLSKETRIALIGPLAADRDAPLGNWRAQAVPNSAVSVLEGMQSGGFAELVYREGCKLSVGDNEFRKALTIEMNDRSGFATAREAAAEADVVVMVLGESAYMSGEARSRAELGLPGLQAELLREVYAVNSNIVLVLLNGRPITLEWEAAHLPAILVAWQPGSEGGHAVTDVLLGEYNPSGRLPMSFPRKVGQIPIYYNHLSTGRPVGIPGTVFYQHHIDVDRSPLFPFGFGLSYTRFAYGEIQLSSKTLNREGILEATINISNTGDRTGRETVQLYIRDRVCTVARPVMELKAFEQVTLKPGESRQLVFRLTEYDLRFYNAEYEHISESGEFDLMIGRHAEDVASVSFRLLD